MRILTTAGSRDLREGDRKKPDRVFVNKVRAYCCAAGARRAAPFEAALRNDARGAAAPRRDDDLLEAGLAAASA